MGMMKQRASCPIFKTDLNRHLCAARHQHAVGNAIAQIVQWLVFMIDKPLNPHAVTGTVMAVL